MLPTTLQRSPIALGNVSVQALGGVLDGFHVQVIGLTGTGDIADYCKQVLDSMKVDGSKIARNGSQGRFISGMTGEAFRQHNNNIGGKMRPEDGFLVLTGRQVFDREDGLTLEVSYTKPTVADVTDTQAVVVIRRIVSPDAMAPDALSIYEGQKLTQAAQKVSTTVPNLTAAAYLGTGLESVTLQLGGSETILDKDFLNASTAFASEHEEDSAAPLIAVHVTSNPRALPAPSFIVYTDSSGLFVQVGSEG